MRARCPPCRPPMCCAPKPPCSPCRPCVYNKANYCIFDLESAVFETRNIYQRACREVIAEYDRSVPDVVLLEAYPMITPEMAELLCRKCELSVPWEQLLDEINARALQLIVFPPLMPGVERLVRQLHKCCIDLALVTRSKHSVYEQKIRGRESFFSLFNVLVCADDPELKQQKPEPDIYLIAMSRFCDSCAKCCLVFDGTVKGVQAARDARMQVVMLPEANLPCCWSARATVRLNTLEDFKPEEFGLPKLEKQQPQKKPAAKKTNKKASKQEAEPAANVAAEDGEEAAEGEAAQDEEDAQ